jgi:ferredoxin
VAVCPVDCFYEGENALMINPDECIDCGACEPECPTTAIFEEGDLPEKWNAYIEINAVLTGAKAPSEADTAGWPDALKAGMDGFEVWPVITEQGDPLPGADDAANEEDKLAALSLKPGAQ